MKSERLTGIVMVVILVIGGCASTIFYYHFPVRGQSKEQMANDIPTCAPRHDNLNLISLFCRHTAKSNRRNSESMRPAWRKSVMWF